MFRIVEESLLRSDLFVNLACLRKDFSKIQIRSEFQPQVASLKLLSYFLSTGCFEEQKTPEKLADVTLPFIFTGSRLGVLEFLASRFLVDPFQTVYPDLEGQPSYSSQLSGPSFGFIGNSCLD